jgi:hypothetical protein
MKVITGFFIWGYMYPFTFIFGGTSKFLGVQSLTLHLGVQRNLTAFSPHKVVHHAVLYTTLQKKNGGTDTKTMDQTEPHFLSDPMSDRKKKVSPTLRKYYTSMSVSGLPTFFNFS